MVMEIYSENIEDIMKYYHSGADQPFNFNLIYLNTSCGGECVKGLVDGFMSNMPEGAWSSQVVGDLNYIQIDLLLAMMYIKMHKMLSSGQ